MSEAYDKIRISGLILEDAERLSDMVEETCDDIVQAVAIDLEDTAKAVWRLEIYLLAGADFECSKRRIARAANTLGLPTLEFEALRVENEDWVSKTQSQLSPISAGRFFVHGGHDRHRRPHNGVAFEIEAAQAFGTGHHATTKGCLLALDRELKSLRPRRTLDLGCGSGILAIAAALATRRPVIAGDIDPVAVEVARQNASANGARGWVRTCCAVGTGHRAIWQSAPYDLVLANILARPLETLAPEISSVLASGGRAILSGLTPDQEDRVISAYRLQGLRLLRRQRLENWSTLVLVS